MNQLEYEALEDEYLTHEARTLYVLCLRRYMDFSTGFVGTARRRISYQQFKEYLSVSRPRRSTIKPFIPSSQQLRGYIEELVRVGLVVRMPKMSKTDPMVFRLPLATTDLQQPDFFHSNEEQHLSNKGQQQAQQQKQQHEEEQRQSQKTQGLQAQEQQEELQPEQQEEQHQSNKEEQHTSVSSVNNTSHTHNAREAESLASFDQRFANPVDAYPDHQPEPGQPTGRKFAMYSSWQPDHTFTDQAKTLGLDLTTLDSEQGERIEQALVEFRTYRIESDPNEANTQRLWQQKFIQTSLKRELEKQRGNAHGNRNQQGKRRHTGSAITRPFTAGDFDLDADF
ncbi:DnaT-like ssDNA-binding domain-containing protein [Endozoicomonas lisbonensis]|uniref:Vacuolar-type H+-ATPase subunit I/STV1 n=1 Tax=Endozoicomonas lisbonensis TaxID=3120522 RepID=A0ABV2SHI1_9GAMM